MITFFKPSILKGILLFVLFSIVSVGMAQTDILSANAIKHIFEGQVKTKKGKVHATGCHHVLAFETKHARIIESTLIKGPNGITKAKVEIYDFISKKWVTKVSNQGYSTIFPENWTKIKTIEEIKFAYNNRIKVKGGYNEYYGLSTDRKVEIRMYLDDKLRIISAFPNDWTRK